MVLSSIEYFQSLFPPHIELEAETIQTSVDTAQMMLEQMESLISIRFGFLEGRFKELGQAFSKVKETLSRGEGSAGTPGLEEALSSISQNLEVLKEECQKCEPWQASYSTGASSPKEGALSSRLFEKVYDGNIYEVKSILDGIEEEVTEEDVKSSIEWAFEKGRRDLLILILSHPKIALFTTRYSKFLLKKAYKEGYEDVCQAIVKRMTFDQAVLLYKSVKDLYEEIAMKIKAHIEPSWVTRLEEACVDEELNEYPVISNNDALRECLSLYSEEGKDAVDRYLMLLQPIQAHEVEESFDKHLHEVQKISNNDLSYYDRFKLLMKDPSNQLCALGVAGVVVAVATETLMNLYGAF